MALFTVYQDRFPVASPHLLGQLEASDHGAAQLLAELRFRGALLVQKATGVISDQELLLASKGPKHPKRKRYR